MPLDPWPPEPRKPAPEPDLHSHEPLPIEEAEAPPPVDPHYQATWEEVLRPAARSASWKLAAILIGTLALFVFSLAGNLDGGVLAMLVGVVFVHEAGHYVGMKAFGFGDVKMFFIPFFGAAVAGEKHAAPAWQHCVVSLLGPLPGIFLAAILYAAFKPAVFETAGTAVLLLLTLNTFNLLPVEPLDGGRFFNRALFSRHPVVKTTFVVLAALALGLIGWLLERWLMGLAALGLLSAIYRYRVASMGRLMRQKLPDLPRDLRELNDAERLALYGIARSIHFTNHEPKAIAATIKSLHQSAVVRPPSLLATLVLLSVYTAGWAASIGTITYMALDALGPDPGAAQEFFQLQAQLQVHGQQIKDLEDRADQLARQAQNDPAAAAEHRAEEQRLRKEIEQISARVKALGEQMAEKRDEFQGMHRVKRAKGEP